VSSMPSSSEMEKDEIRFPAYNEDET
jgi:hypothetical protein